MPLYYKSEPMITKTGDTIPSLSESKTLKSRFYFQKFAFLGMACLLLTLVQVTWAGYQLGVGNQAIQISFLETLHNPQLFSRDIMVQTTMSQYPSWFFKATSGLLAISDVPTLYLTLHLFASVGVMLAVASLSNTLCANHWTALVALLLMLAGHHQALAGESLYSTGFTHTWFVFPWTLLALILFYRGRYWGAFALVGAIFNLHALEAGYLILLFGFVCLCQIRQVGVVKLLGYCGIFLLAAAPTLLRLLAQRHAVYDGRWLQLMHLRSADHSFPTSWWQSGTPDIPRFLSIIALAAVALGFHIPAAHRRKSLLLGGGIGLLFLAGYAGTELWPVPLVIRAQLFRSSRFLLVLALIFIAHGCVRGWQMPWRRSQNLARWRAWLEFANATLIALTLALAPMLVLLPLVLVLAVLVALLNARLAWYQALLAGAAMLVCLAAWQTIEFVIPFLSAQANLQTLGRALLDWRSPNLLGWVMLVLTLVLWVLAQRSVSRHLRLSIMIMGGGTVLALSVFLFLAILKQPASDAAWVDVQHWANAHSPIDTLFLTPAQQGGFRIHSQRGVVGEWRDGTQLYFAANFAGQWWQRMNDLQPDMIIAFDKTSLLSRGRPLGQLDDGQIIEIAQRYKADLVVLPHSTTRALAKVYDNQTWTIFKPQIAAPVVDPRESPQSAQFLKEVVLPNIEKNRKSDAQVQIVDPAGQLLGGVRYRLSQTSSPFGFGCSLPYFQTPAIDFHGDVPPPAVTPAQLARFRELFNFSVIPWSGQWLVLEPKEGQATYADLDRYVEWCKERGIRMEFSFLTGYQPAWMQFRSVQDQSRLMVAHARTLVERYGQRIENWQVISEKVGWEAAPEIFAELRKLSPTIRLGLADDARFWSPRPEATRPADMLRGLEEIRTLKQRGIQVDFFSFQAHRPLGLWADSRDIYTTLDAYAKENVRIHITEFGTPVGARIEGPVHNERWTPELQAAYYERFFTICFSHPSVDVLNVSALGAKSWIAGEGLLDDKDQLTPAGQILKELITQRWRTNLSGTCGSDGLLKFRGFHGTYELTVTPPSGKTFSGRLQVVPGGPNHYRLLLDAPAGKITLSEER